MLDRLNRHDLTDEEWERLRVFLPSARSCCVLDREAVATSRQSRGARRLTQRTAGNRI
jgi:transposase